MMKKLCSIKTSGKDKLAQLMNLEKTKTAIVNYVRAALALGVIEESEDSVTITEQGKRFCLGRKEQTVLLSQFLTDRESGLGELTDALRNEGSSLTHEKLVDCIRLFVDDEHDAKSLANGVLSWYVYAGFVQLDGEVIHSFLPSSTVLMGLDSVFSRTAIDAWLYARLLETEFGQTGSAHPLSYEQISQVDQAFKKSAPESAESAMKDFLSRAYQVMGFSVQYANGPRDQGRLKFGSKGDDFLAFFQTLSPTEAGHIAGIAFACELKRGQADKKAVTQALAFSDVVRASLPAFLVFPLAISDSERYHDDTAITYAESSRVIHLPLDFFREVLDIQLDRFRKGQQLILTLDFVKLVIQLHTDRKVEPRLADLVSPFRQ
jgi:hypothetical protein